MSLVPKTYATQLNNRVLAETMSGEKMEFTTCLMNSQIKFNSSRYSETYPLPQVWISKLAHWHKFIL